MMGVYHIMISWHFLQWREKQVPKSIKTTGLATNHVIYTRVMIKALPITLNLKKINVGF